MFFLQTSSIFFYVIVVLLEDQGLPEEVFLKRKEEGKPGIEIEQQHTTGQGLLKVGEGGGRGEGALF